jgi:cyclopropane-fatty-acyl-phospholipid synthase
VLLAQPENARRAFFDPRVVIAQRLLSRIAHGRLTVVTPRGERLVGEGAPGEEATLHIHRWRALARVLTASDIGFAQAFIDGDCATPDLVALLRLLDRNMSALGGAGTSFGPARWLLRLAHAARANTKAGASRNIMAHYDLGNAFFALWLDASMSYSSALYAHDGETLEAAQARKLDRIVELLDLRGGESALEVGCGWGGLAARLAQAGVGSLDALTISPAQGEYARGSLARQGLDERVKVALRDYRDIEGGYDRIASIEMCEAVGEKFLPLYFATLARSLKAGGRAVIQAITISDARLPSYRASPDFIQRFVFPGGFLPSPALLREQIARAGLKLAHAETFGHSYALTLAEWRRRFHANWPRLAALGFDARFRRLWDYYLCYCEAGFRENTIDVGLYVLTPA